MRQAGPANFAAAQSAPAGKTPLTRSPCNRKLVDHAERNTLRERRPYDAAASPTRLVGNSRIKTHRTTKGSASSASAASSPSMPMTSIL